MIVFEGPKDKNPEHLDMKESPPICSMSRYLASFVESVDAYLNEYTQSCWTVYMISIQLQVDTV